MLKGTKDQNYCPILPINNFMENTNSPKSSKLSNIMGNNEPAKEIKKGNYTFTMIKPFAVRNGFVGHILSLINENGFRIVAMKYVQLTIEQAKAFYIVHKDEAFYERLCKFISSGPIVAAILEKEQAVNSFRDLIGSTNPNDANPGTIRNLFGSSMEHNAVHGSDSDDSAEKEANFFFSKLERY